METIIIAAITFVALVLSLSNKALDVASKYLDIKKKRIEIERMTAATAGSAEQQPGKPASRRISLRRFITEALSSIGLIAVSWKLWAEYTAPEPLTREIVLNVGLLFSLGMFNILSLLISRLERRFDRWVDNFLTAFERTLELIQIIDNNAKLRGMDTVRGRPDSESTS
jgi:hypothetical protein